MKHGLSFLVIMRVLPLIILIIIFTAYTISSVKESIISNQEITDSEGHLLSNTEENDSGWSDFSDGKILIYVKTLSAALLDAWAVMKVLSEFKEWRNKGTELVIKRISNNSLLTPEIARNIPIDGLFDYLLIQCSSPNDTSFIMPINICKIPSEPNSAMILNIGLIFGFTGEIDIKEIQFDSIEVSLFDQNNEYLIKSRLLKKKGINIKYHYDHDKELELLLKVFVDNTLIKSNEEYYFEIIFNTAIINQNNDLKFDSLPVRIYLKPNSEKDDFTAKLIA